MWELDHELYEPIRAILRDACSVFPAVMGPYLGLLGALAHGPVAAAAAYANLQTEIKLVCLHPMSDHSVQQVRQMEALHDGCVHGASAVGVEAPGCSAQLAALCILTGVGCLGCLSITCGTIMSCVACCLTEYCNGHLSFNADVPAMCSRSSCYCMSQSAVKPKDLIH